MMLFTKITNFVQNVLYFEKNKVCLCCRDVMPKI